MKKVGKTIFVRNSFFAETYNVIFDAKKLKSIAERFGYDTDLGMTISQLILEDDIITLSFYISKLFEYIHELEHASDDEKNNFFRLFKIMKFKEFNPENNPYNWFLEAERTLNSNTGTSYEKNGVFSSFDRNNENYDLFFELPTLEQINNLKTGIVKKKRIGIK